MTACYSAERQFQGTANLRDVEGRSALLLGKAKDNNASAAVGPFLRLLDESFSLDDIKKAELTLHVRGEDGFVLTGTSNMAQISRLPESLVSATIGDVAKLFQSVFAKRSARSVAGAWKLSLNGSDAAVNCQF